MGLSKRQIKEREEAYAKIFFLGTEELGYSDSGLWDFLPNVYTKDSIDLAHPIKQLLGPTDVYAIIVLLSMLAIPSLLIPKSRQIRMSWLCCTFAVWFAMSGPVRHLIYQTKSERDADDQTTQGRDNPGEGRMDFIIQHLPKWMQDLHIISGKGNAKGVLKFYPHEIDPDGVHIPWYGSKINAIPQGAKQVRQYTPTIFFSDESAFQDEFEKSMIAASACALRTVCVSSVEAGSFFNQAVLNVPDDWPRNDRGGPFHQEIHPIVKRGMDLMGLEWPRGLSMWQTLSGAWVLEVRYVADPRKDPERDGLDWVNKAVQKVGYNGDFNSVGWQTEMEINYGAGGGDPVFPQLSFASPVFIDGFVPETIKGRFRFFAGYDYGSNSPSAFVVWAVDHDNKAYAVWELYEPCKNMARHVEKIKACPYWDEIEVVVCDPSIMSMTQHEESGGLASMASKFEKYGFYLTRGTRGQDFAIAQDFNSDYWADPENPRAFITKACPNLAREVLGLKKVRHISDAVSIRKNQPEGIRDKDNHAWDATALIFDYGLLPPDKKLKTESKGYTFNQGLKEALGHEVGKESRSAGIFFV